MSRPIDEIGELLPFIAAARRVLVEPDLTAPNLKALVTVLETKVELLAAQALPSVQSAVTRIQRDLQGADHRGVSSSDYPSRPGPGGES